MILALVRDGVVVNRIVVPDNWAGTEKGEWKAPEDCKVVTAGADECHIGDAYADGAFSREVKAERDGKLYSVRADPTQISDVILSEMIAERKATFVSDAPVRVRSKLSELELRLVALENKP